MGLFPHALLVGAAALTAVAAPQAASAQTAFPAKPIALVVQVALEDPKVIERFASLGTEPVAPALATPDALKSHLTTEVKRWGTVIKAAGVKGN
jgi:tripartite-type tricarboxylate transporter receptor subunit TctC